MCHKRGGGRQAHRVAAVIEGINGQTFSRQGLALRSELPARDLTEKGKDRREHYDDQIVVAYEPIYHFRDDLVQRMKIAARMQNMPKDN